MTRALLSATLLVLGAGISTAATHKAPEATPDSAAVTHKGKRSADPRSSRSHERLPLSVVRAPRPRETVPARKPAAEGGSSQWDALAACESGGDWHSTAGMFEGGVQFLNSTWLAYGGGEYAQHAYDATKAQQIRVAERLLAAAGWGQWPVCSRRVGLA